MARDFSKVNSCAAFFCEFPPLFAPQNLRLSVLLRPWCRTTLFCGGGNVVRRLSEASESNGSFCVCDVCAVLELILRRDERIDAVMALFDQQSSEGEGSVIDELTKLIDTEAHVLYTELFKNCTLEDGKSLSKREREEGDLKEEKSLIYGEVDFFSFAAILRKINPEPGTVFYDLGSGTGKALFVARFACRGSLDFSMQAKSALLTCDFGQCTGIEILEGLSNAAAEITKQFSSSYREYLCASQPQEVAVHQCSFLDFDWSDGDVVFANSTCYDEDLMLKLTAQASALKPGAYVITFTKGCALPPLRAD
eukprot:scaffold7352_cov254-Pinguiococcus_pyrenoidosus.AAC.34